MRKSYQIFMLLFFISVVNFAQMSNQVGWISKFGLAGGITASWYFPNYDAVNEQLPAFGIDESFTGGLFALGGAGYVYLMIIDNVRIGGMGFSGSQALTTSVAGYNREVIYSMGGGALSLEYTFPFIKRIAVSAGANFGGGSLRVELFQNKGSADWQSVWDDYNADDPSKNRATQMKNSFFTITPTVNVDVPLTRYIAVRAGAGYQFTLGNSWTIDNDQTLNNVPGNLNGNTFFIQTGLFVGFFAY